MLAQNSGIQQTWTISVPPFDSFRKAGTKLYHLAFDTFMTNNLSQIR